jgi:hypothetical protein
LPYWPVGRAWPNDSEGVPYRFLAQFNFADSHDLVGDLPGEVLLVFVGEEGADWCAVDPPAVHFEWLPLGLEPVASVSPELIAYPQVAFYGAVHRTADYPDAADLVGERDMRQLAFLPSIYGVKIGGFPHPVQDNDYDSWGRLLCQLGSISGGTGVPYPWVNEIAARALFPSDWDTNSLNFMDAGVLYIFYKADGTLDCAFTCY